ncbi:type II toxin-antitoxin system RelE/ParE family toxin [Thioalkalivibrio paradoxus]|uniref:Toxin Y4kP n=1 Tax=Thioalkalivibrio paradoxus ARh 1 TaxID=713585 RepID=W0DLR6_9GAMM|nr:type II toxin-antitoxin system RelE/ParE family toxin [Thioalkalivibrio paradoxus]AHE98172.1 toxin Y4kP [Thioalkalivibrio paradoxus ARh 1]
MKVVLSLQAREDLRDVLGYIVEDTPRAARSVLARIRERVEELQRYPHIGRPGRVPGARELVITGTPYLAPYLAVNDTLQILRACHGAR